MKRVLPFTFVFLLTARSAAAAGFSDIANHSYQSSIQELADSGIIRGYGDGTYRPNQPINRGELVNILIETQYDDFSPPRDTRCFDDFLWRIESAPWYAEPVCLARELGIVGGYPDGTFRPGRAVNLAEAAKIATHALKITAPNLQSNEQWYEPFVQVARDAGALTPLLRDPAHPLTRGEMAELTIRLMRHRDNGNTDDEGKNGTVPGQCGDGVINKNEQCDDGNLTNGDGCSELCISVPEPVRHGALRITQEATAVVDNASAGAHNVALLRFDATAGRQNIELSSVTFKATQGSLVYAKNYELMLDSDGNGSYETSVQSVGRTQGARVIFDDLDDLIIESGETLGFEVRADIAQTAGPITLAIGFATDLDPYVSAIGAEDGRALTDIETNGVCPGSQICWIQVYTGDSGEISISERGNLYVVRAASPIRSHQILAGSITGPLLALILRADGEDIDVTDLRIEGGASSIDSLAIYRNGTLVANASSGQCGGAISATRFCADLSGGMLRVQDNEETMIDIRARIKTDAQGAVSGQSFTLALSTGSAGAPSLEARGVFSNEPLQFNDGDSDLEGEILIGTASAAANSAIGGSPNDIVFAKIGSITNGSAKPDLYPVPSGTSDIGAFTLTALAHGNSFGGSNDVAIDELRFNVSASNAQIDQSSFVLATSDAPGITAACTAAASTGLISVTCGNLSGIQNRIDQNDDVTYILRADVTNTQIQPGNSSLQASLSPLGNRGGASAILWNDEEADHTWVDISETGVSSTLFRSP